MVNTTLGRYQILGELGRGAMGTVYRALDPVIDREVAIKTLHSNLPPEVVAEVRERFLREAKAAGRLNHANIVTVFDVGEQDGVAYMAMELLEGQSLQQMLIDTPRLSHSTVADLVAQIADALDRAQQPGIVHRDVKPANVVVSPSGRAKLTDFGVAYVASSTMTQTGAMIGSPRYMSPEQVLGLPIDPRSDIFSLAVVLYEMLAGNAPFARPEDGTVFPLINRIATEPHPPLAGVDPSIPAAFEVILGKGLAKKPADRYQRAGEMARDLRKILSVMPRPASQAPVGDDTTLPFGTNLQSLSPEFEKTDIQPLVQAGSIPSPEAPQKVAEVLLDLDNFDRDFEAQEQARFAAEQAAERKKAEDLRLWSEAEARRRKEFERQREQSEQEKSSGTKPSAKTGSESIGSATSLGRRAALDLLKQQSRAPEDDAPAKKAKSDAAIDQNMRAALQYLAEVAKEMNAVKPVCGRPYVHLYLGRLPSVRLSNAFADLRHGKVNGRDHAERLFFRFRVQPTAPAKATVLGADIARFEEYLKELKIPFVFNAETKNDFGQVTRGSFTVSASFPCEVYIRADYDKASIELELVDVRRPGRVRYQLEPASLNDMVDDLARYLLGIDDDLEKTLKRA